jgi:hypothetical protein
MTPVQTGLSESLDELAETLARTKRSRSLSEAPLELTNAYVAYLFACGHASLGAHERAHALVEQARAAFAVMQPRVDHDPVHAYAIALCEARVDQALACIHYHAPLTNEVIGRLEGLDRLARYKADNLRESSLLLEAQSIDAVDSFARFHRRPKSTPKLDELRGLDERARQIRGVIDRGEPLDATTLRECLDQLIGLSEDPGVPLLVDLLPRIADCDARLDLYTRALTATAHFGWGELVPSLVEQMRGELRTSPSPEAFTQAISPSVRAMRRLGTPAELTIWIDDLEAHDTPANHRLILAAARTVIGDPRAGDALITAVEPLGKNIKHTDRLDLIRRVAVAYAHTDVSAGSRYLLALTRYFPALTDTFGTNTHFCRSVVWFVDAVVYGVLGLDFSRPGWAPRE